MTPMNIASLRILTLVASLACLLVETVLAAPPGSSADRNLSFQAQSALESVRSSVLQIRTLPLGSDSPYSYGSGFAVGPDKLILTNYHVVSSVIMDPDRYRLEFLREDGRKGALVVLAIDVAHDLAVVRGDTGLMPGLSLDQRVPEKGVRGFSIGFPENQGITVTEGIVNGLSEDSARGAIHFSGPVNSGMSGGPAIDTSGRAFGVNVASLRSTQLISLVVPASAAVALLDRARSTALPTAQGLFLNLSRQLQANSITTLAFFPDSRLPVQQLGRFQAPGNPGEFARCSARSERDADKLYRIEQYGCHFKDETFVANGLYMGHWLFSHRYVQGAELGAQRFARLEESLLRPGDGTTPTNRIHKTRWNCQNRIVSLSGTRAKAVVCLRRYARFEGLYDLELKLATLDSPVEALISSLGVYGFGYPESMALARRFMETIAWKP